MSGNTLPTDLVDELTPRLLSEEEQDQVRLQKQAMDKVFQDAGKARYKIELMFGKARSVHNPTPGIMCFWESGAKLHGGGDAKVYGCPGKHLGANECEGMIPDTANGVGNLVCPVCHRAWQADQVIGEILANLPLQKWADVIVKYFVRLGHNADIYLKYARTDIRHTINLNQSNQNLGEQLTQTRSDRVPLIYTLDRIIKDTSNGADLQKRFFAFLNA